MRLHVGERLPGYGPASHPGGYVVTAVVTETPWYGLYAGKKIFYNFDFTGKRPRETDEAEWLDVYLRTINYPRLDDPNYVAERRTLARAELRRILGNRTSNLWPEPLDLLEIPNTRDPFTFAPGPGTALEPRLSQLIGTEPVIVFARPQGEPVARWQQEVQALSHVLGILAELLEFIRAAHGDGVLLNGLGPGGVLVDPVGRVHYLGSDMALEMPAGTRLASASLAPGPVIDWARFFPPERYPRGFSAPECFDPSRPRDRRTDLYAWAVMTYFLLTRDRPAQLALAQGRPWILFGPPQWALLERGLRMIPPAHVHTWGEQLGVNPGALVKGWPHNFLATLRECVRPDPRQRPASVADLRTWLTEPPPAPLPAAVAVFVPPHGPVRLYLDVENIEPGLALVVRRGFGSPPTRPEEGELVFEGPPRPWVEDAGWLAPVLPGQPSGLAAVHYAVFIRASREGREVYSAGIFADVLEPNPEAIRGRAEGGAAPGPVEEPEPGRVRLLFQAFDPLVLAQLLLGSSLPQVRAWAVRRLVGMMKQPEAVNLLWSVLRDAVPAIRLEAVRGLLGGMARPPEARVRRVVEALGGANPDDCIEAARSLAGAGIAPEVIAATVAAIERDRPVACPECGQNVPGPERAAHLINTHGYVDIFGTLLSRPEALARLWERTFAQEDDQAHDRACQLLFADPFLSGEEPPYVRALEEQLRRRADQLLAARERQLPAVVDCLRRSFRARPYFAHLLASADARVREVGRELILPDLGERLAGEEVTSKEVRRELDKVCRPGQVEEKIQLCQRLPSVGVDAGAAAGCLRELEKERPVACPECRGQVAAGDMETHLRRAHGVYQFRGVRRPLEETLNLLLAAVCGPSPDYEAWRTLERIAQEEFRADADAFLVGRLGKTLLTVPSPRRGPVLAAAAEAMVAGGSGVRLARALAEQPRRVGEEPVAALLALDLTARLPAPLPTSLISAVRPLLAEKDLPVEPRLDAAASLMRATGKAGQAANEILRAVTDGLSKTKAIDRLRLLEQRVGNSPAIDDLCAKLEDQVRMICPRCSVQMRRPEMRKHLWDEHRLLLEGRRVRDPWRLIEDWLEDYRLEREAAVLARCRGLARRLQGDKGVNRLERLMLAHGIENPEVRRRFLTEARRRHQSLCPHCFGLVPPREDAPPTALHLGPTWLTAAPGYRVQVSEFGLVPHLVVEKPDRLLFRSREPGRGLTRWGALFLLALPPFLAALFLALFPPPGLPVLALVLGPAGLGLLLTLWIVLRWPAPINLLDRVIDHAWVRLLRPLTGALSPEDASFAAGLALVSAGRGTVEARAETLKRLREEAEKQVSAGPGSARHLAVYWRLSVEDAATRSGADPVPLVVAQLGRCFDGKLPLSFATQFLAGWDSPWWTPTNLARLRVLLCERAFEAGLEVSDLVEMGRLAPNLGTALRTDDPAGLGQLRLLWAQRQEYPWEKFGPAVPVFALAAAPGKETRLAEYFDLLVALEDAQVCGRGVVFRGEVFREPPRTVEVIRRPLPAGGGFELVLGERRFVFPEDPEPLARRLERLLRYYFLEFRPQAASAQQWRSPDAARGFRARNAVPCPDCRRLILTRVGEVGVSLDGEEKAGKDKMELVPSSPG